MCSILDFTGSNSSNNLNFKLLKYTVSRMKWQNISILNAVNCPFSKYFENTEKVLLYTNELRVFLSKI